jgi:hypothetical protein
MASGEGAEVEIPPVVYVPARQPAPDDTDVTLVLRELADGRVALLAYTAMDRLVAACGERQPWALVQSSRLEEMRTQGGGWDVVLLDPHLPDELREDADGDADATGFDAIPGARGG